MCFLAIEVSFRFVEIIKNGSVFSRSVFGSFMGFFPILYININPNFHSKKSTASIKIFLKYK